MRAGTGSWGIGLLLFALLLTTHSCGLWGGWTAYRYRMTVHIDTPSGPRSGSGVIEVAYAAPGPLSASAFRREVRGEAVAVDLPGGTTLFALLGSHEDRDSGAELYADQAYAGALPHGYDWKEGVEALRRQTEAAVLPAGHSPRLVRFRNPNDARTIEVLDPSDLEAALGPGVRLDRVEIRITEDPVTSANEARLPSLGKGSGWDEWVRSLRYDDPRYISSRDLRRGV